MIACRSCGRRKLKRKRQVPVPNGRMVDVFCRGCGAEFRLEERIYPRRVRGDGAKAKARGLQARA
jgi:hypothetical protein